MTSRADSPAEAERCQFCVPHLGPEASIRVEEPLGNERIGVWECILVVQDRPEKREIVR